MYKCKNCDAPVLVVPNEKPVRTCSCNSTIIAECEGTATGVGGVRT